MGAVPMVECFLQTLLEGLVESGHGQCRVEWSWTGSDLQATFDGPVSRRRSSTAEQVRGALAHSGWLFDGYPETLRAVCARIRDLALESWLHGSRIGEGGVFVIEYARTAKDEFCNKVVIVGAVNQTLYISRQDLKEFENGRLVRTPLRRDGGAGPRARVNRV